MRTSAARIATRSSPFMQTTWTSLREKRRLVSDASGAATLCRDEHWLRVLKQVCGFESLIASVKDGFDPGAGSPPWSRRGWHADIASLINLGRADSPMAGWSDSTSKRAPTPLRALQLVPSQVDAEVRSGPIKPCRRPALRRHAVITNAVRLDCR